MKSVLAVYVGVYLLLPGCLCQVLSAFGVSTHSHYTPEQNEWHSDITVISCHCSDFCQKAADLQNSRTQTELVPEIAWTFVELPVARERSKSSVLATDRGPPGFIPFTAPRFTGSFRI